MSLFTWDRPHFKHDQSPAALEKYAKRAAADKALRDAYAAVDARDKRTCRATGRPLMAGAVDPRMRLERHHLVKRSASQAGIADARNIVTLAADVHRLVEAHAIEIEGTDANGRLIFRWNKKVLAGKAPPFQLLSKRRSQNRSQD